MVFCIIKPVHYIYCMRMVICSCLILISVGFLACKQSLSTISLEEEGLPVTLSAPPNTDIKSFDLIIMRELTVSSAQTGIQLLVVNQFCESIEKVLIQQKDKVLSNYQYCIILEEWYDGFSFRVRSQNDTGSYTYGLRRVICKDSTQVIIKEINPGLPDFSSLQDAEKMANSASWIN